MTTRIKIIIDRLLGVPIAYLLNIGMWIAGKFVPRNHSFSEEKVKIIIISKYLGYGSIIQSLPMVAVLKKKYKTSKFILLTTKKHKDVVELLNLFDDFIFIRDDKFIFILIDSFLVLFKLWKLKIDLFFDLEVYSSYSTLIQALSLARNRYGFFRKTSNFRKGLNTHLIFFNTRQHISRAYLQFAAVCGIEKREFEYKFVLKYNNKEKINENNNLFGRLNIDYKKEYIIVNPNSSDLMLERRWPKEKFCALIEQINHIYNYDILIIGSTGERYYAESIFKSLPDHMKNKTIVIAGNTSLKELVYLIEKAKILITCDSGPAHIASLTNTPAIVLFGPVSPKQYSTFNKNHIALYLGIYCSPCLYHTDFPICKGDNQCMKLISVKEVLDKFNELMNNSSIDKNNAIKYLIEKPYGLLKR